MRIKDCYSTWGETYYEDYYGEGAAYPPVHVTLLKQLLKNQAIKTVLDAGCGPASFLRELFDEPLALYGFDLTPEMVKEGQRIFKEQGLPDTRLWEGSVLTPDSFYCEEGPEQYDAAVCIGVLPHISEGDEKQVFQNLYQSVRPGGLVVIEARNQLFSLFTLNRYSYQFFMDELIPVESLRAKGEGSLDNALDELKTQFRMDVPPLRKGQDEQPGYDEILSRTHNPLLLQKQFTDSGFQDVKPPEKIEPFRIFFMKHFPVACGQKIARQWPLDWTIICPFWIIGWSSLCIEYQAT